MLRQFTFILKSHNLDCFDFLQKYRNDRVSKFVIARALPEAIHKIKTFYSVLLSPKVESLYPLDSNLQSKVALIRFCAIDFIYSLKSRGLDTSLHCVSLSMTNYCHKKKNPVILRALARSIHFSDFRITLDSLTLGESKSNFGLLRQICDLPRNDEVGRFVIARFGFRLNRGNPLPTPLLKESKCKLKS